MKNTRVRLYIAKILVSTSTSGASHPPLAHLFLFRKDDRLGALVIEPSGASLAIR